MRASTAAGINNSLLPQERICGEFACGHLLVVPSGKGSLSLAFVWTCRKRLRGSAIRGALFLTFVGCGGAVRGRGLLSLVFVGFAVSVFAVVLYGKRSLFPGIFGIRHIRYRRGPPGVRN